MGPEGLGVNPSTPNFCQRCPLIINQIHRDIFEGEDKGDNILPKILHHTLSPHFFKAVTATEYSSDTVARTLKNAKDLPYRSILVADIHDMLDFFHTFCDE